MLAQAYNIKKYEVAEMAGLARGTMYQWLEGNYEFGEGTAEKIEEIVARLEKISRAGRKF